MIAEIPYPSTLPKTPKLGTNFKMPNDSSPKGNFDPIHEAHSIEQVIFTVQFDRPLDDNLFAEVLKAAEPFKTDLPGQENIQRIAVAIGPQGVMPQIPAGSGKVPIGRQFRRMRPDGSVENELIVERQSVIFRTLQYLRWTDTWSRAKQYLDILIPIYFRQASVSVVGLNFVDKFTWTGNLEDFNPSMLLRARSVYLCPHIFEVKDLWHSHTGAFIRIDKNTKRLININVDCLDEQLPDGPRRVVAATTVLTDLFNQPDYEPLAVAEGDAVSFLDIHMQRLHADGKKILGSIIDDTMSKRIALTG